MKANFLPAAATLVQSIADCQWLTSIPSRTAEAPPGVGVGVAVGFGVGVAVGFGVGVAVGFGVGVGVGLGVGVGVGFGVGVGAGVGVGVGAGVAAGVAIGVGVGVGAGAGATVGEVDPNNAAAADTEDTPYNVLTLVPLTALIWYHDELDTAFVAQVVW
jgi:hypothetical protein